MKDQRTSPPLDWKQDQAETSRLPRKFPMTAPDTPSREILALAARLEGGQYLLSKAERELVSAALRFAAKSVEVSIPCSGCADPKRCFRDEQNGVALPTCTRWNKEAIKPADDGVREEAAQQVVLAHWRSRFPSNMYAPPGVPSEWALEAVRALSTKAKP